MSEDPARAVIRTHLANERTFLAWLRSGLTVVALGVAAAQLLEEHDWHGIPLHTVFAILLSIFGGVLVVIGRWRYRQTAVAIRDGHYRAHRRVLEVAVFGSLLVILFAVLLVLRMAK